jgi:hypothetical protein
MSRHEYPSLRQGLVGAWCPSLGASGLSLIDRSGRGTHGAITGIAQPWGPVAGVPAFLTGGTGVATSPANSYLDFERTESFSVSFWMRTTSNSTEQSVIGNLNLVAGSAFARGFEVGIRVLAVGSQAIQFFLISNYPSSAIHVFSPGGSIAVNQWYHVAATFRGAGAASVGIFINGLSQTITTLYDTLTTTSKSALGVAIGRRRDATIPFSGGVDDIRIYNRALTPAEIRLLASRRGIGLTPLPDRAAGLPKKLFVNDAGTWRDGDAYVNTGSGWRLGVPFVNVAGTWR